MRPKLSSLAAHMTSSRPPRQRVTTAAWPVDAHPTSGAQTFFNTGTKGGGGDRLRRRRCQWSHSVRDTSRVCRYYYWPHNFVAVVPGRGGGGDDRHVTALFFRRPTDQDESPLHEKKGGPKAPKNVRIAAAWRGEKWGRCKNLAFCPKKVRKRKLLQ